MTSLQLWRGGRQLATSALEVDGAHVRANLVVLPGRFESIDDVVDCVRVVHDEAGRSGGEDLVLFSLDPLVRDAARRLGMTGDLRSALMADARRPLPGTGEPVDLVAALRGLGVEAAVRPTKSGIGRLLRSSATGVWRSATFDVGGDGVGFRLTVPASEEVLPEQVGRIADTALSVTRRFSPWSVLREVSVDRSSRGLSRGHTAGEYGGNRTISLSTTAVVAADQIAEGRRMVAKRDPFSQPTDARPVFAPAVHVRVEKTVVHEIGHLVWTVFSRRDGSAAREFDMALGQALGGRRLADVLDGARPGAPEAWAAAAERVRTEVSDYAMTSVDELIAELFGHWWTRDGWSPLLRTFDRLVAEYLPSP